MLGIRKLIRTFAVASAMSALLLPASSWHIAAAAQADRHALIVGNAAYHHTEPLETPAGDAGAMAEALRALDFQVTLANDLDGASLANNLATFLRTISDGDVALLYFSGHGMQFQGQNFLLPVDS